LDFRLPALLSLESRISDTGGGESMRRPLGRIDRATGFTLIELMVTVSILAVVLGLTLAAVQQAQETARRLTCVNQLKQIALAVQNYASTYGYFPPIDCQTSGLGKSTGQLPSAHYFSPLARTLNYLDQVQLYNSINFGSIPDSPSALIAHRTAMAVSIGGFLCPSDGLCPVRGFGRTNYRFNIGPTHVFAPGASRPESWLGPFTVHRVYSPSAFLDGLSNTIGVSERCQGDWTKDSFKQGGDYYMRPYADGPFTPNADAAVEVCNSLPSDVKVESRGGESWLLSGFHFTNYNHCLGPNPSKECSSWDDVSGSIHDRLLHEGVFSATSRHPGGVVASAMDGSVRFVSSSVALPIWRAVATRAGGEIAALP
jgi:prepilin-type N-terminal cleavage/methylation domain-containing protein